MTMKERLRSRVAELTSIIGVSGHEWDVAKYIFDAIKDDVDTIEQLPNGIIVATKKGAHPGPRVMVSAHMDEVGYEVKSVSPQGYLYFDQIGGATIACLPGRRVLVKGEKGVELLTVCRTLILDCRTLVRRTLKFHQHGIGCGKNGLGGFQIGKNALIALAQFLVQEFKLHTQISNRLLLALRKSK